MALIRWRPRTKLDPFGDLMGMQDEINRLFDITLGRSAFDHAGLFDGEWAPAIDVYENDDKVVVKTELPGLSEKDIEVDILGDTLTIKGEKRKEEEKKDKHYHRVERTYGSFHRTVTLPGMVESEKAKASFKNGVLEITIPKKEEAKPRQVKVDVG
jgi:HSP20 family protein